MSNKREREKRREERMAAESKVDSADRRSKILQLGAGVAFLAVVVLLIVIVVTAGSGDGGGDVDLENVSEVNQSLEGIPQSELVLGDPDAPVEFVEFGDLQCPVCKAAAENVLPQVIEGPVAQGQTTLVFRNFAFLGEQSPTAGAAAVAAGMQGRGWNFIEIFYRNQGRENSGYANDAFLTAVAEAAGVEDIEQWNKDRNSAKAKDQVEASTAEAPRLGFTGTPSYAVKGPNTSGLEPLGTLTSAGEVEEAINSAG